MYCGLVDAKIRAPDKDLPVPHILLLCVQLAEKILNVIYLVVEVLLLYKLHVFQGHFFEDALQTAMIIIKNGIIFQQFVTAHQVQVQSQSHCI